MPVISSTLYPPTPLLPSPIPIPLLLIHSLTIGLRVHGPGWGLIFDMIEQVLQTSRYCLNVVNQDAFGMHFFLKQGGIDNSNPRNLFLPLRVENIAFIEKIYSWKMDVNCKCGRQQFGGNISKERCINHLSPRPRKDMQISGFWKESDYSETWQIIAFFITSGFSC